MIKMIKEEKGRNGTDNRLHRNGLSSHAWLPVVLVVVIVVVVVVLVAVVLFYYQSTKLH